MSHHQQQPAYAGLSDIALADLVRAGAPTARPATQELHRRHLPRLLTYARLCSRIEGAAHQLASRALALAWQDMYSSTSCEGPLRHRLFGLVHRAAAAWVTDNRRAWLDEGYAAFLGTSYGTGPAAHQPTYGARPFLARGFDALPARTQGLLWHVVVEQDVEADVALYTGQWLSQVPALTARVRDEYREACLRIHTEACEATECFGFARILDAAARRKNARRNADLAEHLMRCPRCDGVLRDLVDLHEMPRSSIAEAVLGWGGTAYLAAPAEIAPDVSSSAPARTRDGQDRPRPRAAAAHARRTTAHPAALLSLCALVVLAATSTAFVSLGSGGDPSHGTGTPHLPSIGPAGQSTPAAVPSATKPSGAPSARPSPTPSRSPRSTPSTVPPSPRSSLSPSAGFRSFDGAAFTPAANVVTGMCLDVRGSTLTNGTDVISAPCRPGAHSQQWHVDSNGLLHNRADTQYCPNSGGRTDQGVGIWECAAYERYDGEPKLRFFSDPTGRIRPTIAPVFAVAPDGSTAVTPVFFAPAGADAGQRWSGEVP
ncbi:ricin-type beta-trefoil lectin domain protein [Streptomyces avermitilis]